MCISFILCKDRDTLYQIGVHNDKKYWFVDKVFLFYKKHTIYYNSRLYPSQPSQRDNVLAFCLFV